MFGPGIFELLILGGLLFGAVAVVAIIVFVVLMTSRRR